MPKCRICKSNIDKEKDSYVRAKLSYVCEGECADTFIANHIEKGKNKKRIRQNKKRKQTSDLALTQTVFNKYIRIRDSYPSCKCISCGYKVTYGSQSTHAGHYKTVGSRSDLRFNEDNVHAQCEQCNYHNNCRAEGGVSENYAVNIVQKIGQKRVDALNEQVQQDYSDKNLKVIRLKYNKKIKKLGG